MVGIEVNWVSVEEAPLFSSEMSSSAVVEKDGTAERPDLFEASSVTSGPRNSSSPAEASAGAMIEKDNERLSPLSLTRIMVGELRAITQKLCVSIQRGGACRNKCRHA